MHSSKSTRKKLPRDENELIAILTASWRGDARVLQGVGDDCAVICSHRPKHFLLLKTDAVVEGRHFTTKTPARLIGRKALARVISDFAAMGGTPCHALVTLGLPAAMDWPRLRSIYQGLTALARQFKLNLVGGETSRTHELILSIAALGETDGYPPILRSGAKKGDLLFVTGKLGRTQGKKHLHFVPRIAEGVFLARHHLATAMMDLSDGLGTDLPRLAQASQLRFEIDPTRLPLARGATWQQACADGEDYELLFTVSPKHVTRLLKTWPFATPLTEIGRMDSLATGIQAPTLLPHGFDHLRHS